MKVLIVSLYYPPDLGAGSFRAAGLVEELLRRGQEVTILSATPNRYGTFKPEVIGVRQSGVVQEIRINFNSRKTSFFSSSIAYFCFFIRALVASRKLECDLVFATSSRFFTGLLGLIIARTKKKPLFLDVRDIFSDSLELVVPKFLKSSIRIIFYLENLIIRSADHLNFVSEGFSDTYILPENIPVSYFSNGIDDIFLDVKKSKASTKKISITYAGNIGLAQDLHNFLPALCIRYPAISFTVIGDGSGFTLLSEAISSLNLKNIRLSTPIGREALIEEYIRSDILLLNLQKIRGFEKVLPSKIFEYAAFNKPIIAGVSGYCRKFLDRNVSACWCVKNSDAESYSEAIEEVLTFLERDEAIDRSVFVLKFQRKIIMRELADTLLALGVK